MTAVAEESNLITTEAELKEALHNAKEGDTILVGDISFAYSPMGMTLSKSVTIKSGKDTPAVFSGGAFAVMGGSSVQDTVNVQFEHITFVGVNDIDNIDFTGKQIMTATKIRPAVFFSRCVDAEFRNCDFTGYSMANGGAVYGIYSSSDSVGHRLSLSFEECALNANAGGYGGAIYLSGVGNIFLNMKNCELSRNVAAYGGAIWADQTAVTLENCTIRHNRFVDFYPNTLTKGGGIYVGRGTLSMKNCVITDNAARNGGGVALSYTESVIDGCVISGNTAKENGGGIWNENYGNNLVTVVNTTIANNTASSGGAFYISENDAVVGSGGVGKTYFVLSTLSGNAPSVKEYGEECLSLFGCALYGEGQSEAMPTEANQYCYFIQTKHPGNPYDHLTGTVEMDDRVLENVAGNRFNYRYGTFCAGDNARAETVYRFFVNGKLKDTVTVGYGKIPVLPIYEKNGYIFDHWQLNDKSEYRNDVVLSVGGGTETVDLYAVWVRDGNAQNPVWIVLMVVVTLVVLAYVAVVIGMRRAQKEKNPPAITDAKAKPMEAVPAAVVSAATGSVATVTDAPGEPVQRIVRMLYTDEEIAQICRICAETQLLTGRERDVFIEMLKGRKQSEIGYYLGISVPYVKDNARRIYNKFDVANKNELFEKIASELQKQK